MTETGQGSKDGEGAADCDLPYIFGRKPRAIAPWPFTERQFARLLIVRGHFDRHELRDRRGDFIPTKKDAA